MSVSVITAIPVYVRKFFAMGSKHSANVRKQQILATVCSLTIFFFLTVFGARAFVQGNTMLGVVCVIGSIVTFANLLFLRITGHHQLASLVIVALMGLLSLYLVCSGGSNNTRLLWC